MRFLGYLLALAVVLLLAYVLGHRSYEVTQCSGYPRGAVCDTAALGGFAGVAAAFVLFLVVVAMKEIERARRQRLARTPPLIDVWHQRGRSRRLVLGWHIAVGGKAYQPD